MSKLRAVIVDDEEVLQDVLTSLVREEGHEPVVARTGEEALTLLEREEIDLVLLDLMLPGLSGMEVMRQVREHDRRAPRSRVPGLGGGRRHWSRRTAADRAGP